MGRGEVIQRHRRIKFCLACYLGLGWQEVFLYPFLLLSSSLLFHPTFSLLLHSMELNHCPTVPRPSLEFRVDSVLSLVGMKVGPAQSPTHSCPWSLSCHTRNGRS